jgi:hypothetical protein
VAGRVSARLVLPVAHEAEAEGGEPRADEEQAMPEVFRMAARAYASTHRSSAGTAS